MINTPSPFAEIIGSVCAQDRVFFEANPHVKEYIRAYVIGEFWPLQYTNLQMVKVRCVAAGVRLREPILDERNLN